MTQSISPAALLKALIACPSVTPADGGAQDAVAGVLEDAGFAVSRKAFGGDGTPAIANLFATIGDGAPHLAFAGHTDVVPPGDEAQWSHPPFAGEVVEGMMYGRGAVDMKGGIAAFVAAALDFVVERPRANGTVSLLITGDEEGHAVNGTAKLLDWVRGEGCAFDAVIVGEPTSEVRLGETVKVGRRGSLSATIRVAGRQGHAAYPERADNPIPRLVAILARLTALKLDNGSANFAPSRLEVTSVDVGNRAFNVIPADAAARFNVRFNDRWSLASLTDHLRHEIAAAALGCDHQVLFEPGAADCFLTGAGPLVDIVSAAIEAETGIVTRLSTGGGTSDARFFKDVCPVVEFGLVGDTMHQVDERVSLGDLTALTAIYRGVLDRFFTGSGK